MDDFGSRLEETADLIEGIGIAMEGIVFGLDIDDRDMAALRALLHALTQRTEDLRDLGRAAPRMSTSAKRRRANFRVLDFRRE